MLSNCRVHATLPAADLDRARSFYSEKLGLEPTEESPGGLFYEFAGGTRFLLFPTGGRASGEHTQMGFRTDDITAEVAALKERGVEFIEYDTPGLKTEGGIAQVGANRAAWFRDSEGNLLGVVQLAD